MVVFYAHIKRKACLTYLQKVAILKSRNGKLTLHIEGEEGLCEKSFRGDS